MPPRFLDGCVIHETGRPFANHRPASAAVIPCLFLVAAVGLFQALAGPATLFFLNTPPKHFPQTAPLRDCYLTQGHGPATVANSRGCFVLHAAEATLAS